MYKNGLKTIVLLASDMQTYYCRELSYYISLKCKELGYNLAILHWNNPFGQTDNYVMGEASIFEFFDLSEADAIIYLKDVFSNQAVEERVEKKLAEYTCPKVSPRMPLDGYYSILINDSEAIKEVVRHFIDKHKCKKIAYMSGVKGRPDAKARLRAYMDVMDENGLEYDDSYIFHGNYWTDKGGEAVDYFLSSPLGVPEAIVCANDYMAMSVVEALTSRGYRVPENIKVSGFDNVDNPSDISLTTVDIDIKDLAYNSVEIIDDLFNGRDRDLITMIKGVMLERKSCGCNSEDGRIFKNSNVFYDSMDSETIYAQTRYFTVALQDIESLDDAVAKIDKYMYLNGRFNNFFLCLQTDPESDNLKQFISTRKEFQKKLTCVLAMMDNKNVNAEPFKFDSSDYIPAQYTTEEPQIYCFSSIHIQDEIFGYAAISYYDYRAVKNDYYSFAVNIGNALDSLSKRLSLKKTLMELEELYISDPLTGLFNRRGFEFKTAQYYVECTQKKIPFMLMTIDMDGLKYINDTYGHIQGDIAINTLGRALDNARTQHNEVCARVGGDEFYVFAMNYDNEKADDFKKRVYNYLDEYNQSSDNQYMVEASCGVVVVDTYEDNEDVSLEYYMKLCDYYMYQNKRERKRGRTS